jgi:hypothetical protein
MNIISKIGAVMAKNRVAVKTILDKYNIPAGATNESRIRAAFTAIKGGNTDLAAELSALSSVNGKKPLLSKGKAKNIIDAVKSNLAGIKTKLAAMKRPGGGQNGQPVPTTVNPIYSYPDPTVNGKAVSAENQIISGSQVITDHPADDHALLNIPDSVNQLSADGIEGDSAALVSALQGSDVETNIMEASASAKAADLSDTRTIIALSLVFIVVLVALFNPGKLLKSK